MINIILYYSFQIHFTEWLGSNVIFPFFANVANFLIPRNPVLRRVREISKFVKVVFDVEQCQGITQRSPRYTERPHGARRVLSRLQENHWKSMEILIIFDPKMMKTPDFGARFDQLPDEL